MLERRSIRWFTIWLGWTLIAFFFATHSFINAYLGSQYAPRSMTLRQALILSLSEWYAWAALAPLKRPLTARPVTRDACDLWLFPTISSGDAPRSEPSTTPPSVDQILDRYIDAAGGRSAIEKISTRISKGTFQGPGVRATVERIQKTPARLLMVVQLPKGTASFGFDGSRGWEKGPGSASAREAPPDDENVAPFQWDADLHRDLKLRELYTKVSVATQETIDGGSAWVVEAESRRRQTEKLYFDSQTGLLLRRLQIRESPLGPVPLQMDFGDYREIDGVKVPFFSRWARPGVTLIFQYDEVRHNLPVEDARFEKP